MAKIDLPELLNTLVGELSGLLKTTLGNAVTDAKADAQRFVEQNKDNLQRWAGMYASGKLTATDLEALLRSSKNLFDMELLKQSGVALITVDKFKNDAIAVIVKCFSTLFYL
ncbi:MAG: hypothetical protein LBF39_01040 [Prevotellaceae bacterium]|jgi:hypothetical protein|nr:hypothetical protein [Prevotellaceae bacterium]